MAEERPQKRVRRDHDRSAKGGVPQANPFVEMLQSTVVREIMGPRKVVILQSDQTVHDAMQTLGRFKILSAPVIDSKTNDLLGFVDVRDVATLLIKIAQGASTLTHPHPSIPTHNYLNNNKSERSGPPPEWKFEYTREQLNKFNDIFFNTRVGEIIDASHGSPSMSVSGLSPLFQAIGLFQKGVNRVTILSPEGHAENVLSQSDIVRFLVAKMDDFPAVFDKTANEIGLARKKNLIRIHKSEPTLKAVYLLLQHKISGVAVVDDDGSLIGNFSASDLKGRGVTDYGEGSDPFGSLVLPVFQFIKQGGMSTFPVGTVRPTTAFSLILLKLIAMRVHRLWVVNDNMHPVGVITLTDVMQALINEKQPDRKE